MIAYWRTRHRGGPDKAANDINWLLDQPVWRWFGVRRRVRRYDRTARLLTLKSDGPDAVKQV